MKAPIYHRALRNRRIDRLLLQIAMLTTPKERDEALEKLAAKEGKHVLAFVGRMEFLGVKYLNLQMGPAAAKAWLKYMKKLIDLEYGTFELNMVRIQLFSLSGKAYDSVLAYRKSFEQASYSVGEAARLLRVPKANVLFWADTLERLERNEEGKFTGKELKRFIETDMALLAGFRMGRRI